MKILVPHERTLRSVDRRAAARRNESECASAMGSDETSEPVSVRLRPRSRNHSRPFEREEALLAQPAKTP